MKWLEPIIIIDAIGLVLLPIFLQIKNKKKVKSSCSCGCSYCSQNSECCKEIKKTNQNNN